MSRETFLEKKAGLPSDSTQGLTECKHEYHLKGAAKPTVMCESIAKKRKIKWLKLQYDQSSNGGEISRELEL